MSVVFGTPIGPSVVFSPVGGSGPVQSPTATEPFLPAISFYSPEGNAVVIPCSFFDENGNAMTPTSIIWSLSDDNGNIVNFRLDQKIAVPAPSVNIVLSGNDVMRMVFDDLIRFLKVSGTYNSPNGQGLTFAGQYRFGLVALAVET
jgi:hypothetical protein